MNLQIVGKGLFAITASFCAEPPSTGAASGEQLALPPLVRPADSANAPRHQLVAPVLSEFDFKVGCTPGDPPEAARLKADPEPKSKSDEKPRTTVGKLDRIDFEKLADGESKFRLPIGIGNFGTQMIEKIPKGTTVEFMIPKGFKKDEGDTAKLLEKVAVFDYEGDYNKLSMTYDPTKGTMMVANGRGAKNETLFTIRKEKTKILVIPEGTADKPGSDTIAARIPKSISGIAAASASPAAETKVNKVSYEKSASITYASLGDVTEVTLSPGQILKVSGATPTKSSIVMPTDPKQEKNSFPTDNKSAKALLLGGSTVICSAESSDTIGVTNERGREKVVFTLTKSDGGLIVRPLRTEK